jgi:hypothetical protein
VEAATLLELAEGVEELRRYDEDFLSAPVESEQLVEPLVGQEVEFDRAEERFRCRKLSAGDLGKIHDDSTVQSLARIYWPTAERIRRVQELESEVANLLGQPAVWMAVKVVAQALLNSEFLTGAEVSELCRDARAT